MRHRFVSLMGTRKKQQERYSPQRRPIEQVEVLRASSYAFPVQLFFPPRILQWSADQPPCLGALDHLPLLFLLHHFHRVKSSPLVSSVASLSSDLMVSGS